MITFGSNNRENNELRLHTRIKAFQFHSRSEAVGSFRKTSFLKQFSWRSSGFCKFQIFGPQEIGCPVCVEVYPRHVIRIAL